ncbi:MAG TPA: hypothetical protein VFB35_05620 [Gaiellaceae bacterium]|nr:hypothetical protein [Gaiellaceae bacterium]
MNTQYLMLVEQLVRDGRTESEIEAIVERVVGEDAAIGGDGAGELPAAA